MHCVWRDHDNEVEAGGSLFSTRHWWFGTSRYSGQCEHLQKRWIRSTIALTVRSSMWIKGASVVITAPSCSDAISRSTPSHPVHQNVTSRSRSARTSTSTQARPMSLAQSKHSVVPKSSYAPRPTRNTSAQFSRQWQRMVQSRLFQPRLTGQWRCQMCL